MSSLSTSQTLTKQTKLRMPQQKTTTLQAMPLEGFHKTLEHHAGRPLKMRINDNHSTMLSVRWEPDHTRVSLHRMFLNAPTNVMEALACYLKGNNRSLTPTLKQYIEQCRQQLDYSSAINPTELSHQGRYYHLLDLYNEVNEEYFEGRVKLHITWFGQPQSRNRSRISFGLYHDTLRLIKINRVLDHPNIPRFLITYVIYHEMLHHICPPNVDGEGIHRIHNREFKQREMEFRYYQHAVEWIRQNKVNLFAGVTNGRT